MNRADAERACELTTKIDSITEYNAYLIELLEVLEKYTHSDTEDGKKMRFTFTAEDKSSTDYLPWYKKRYNRGESRSSPMDTRRPSHQITSLNVSSYLNFADGRTIKEHPMFVDFQMAYITVITTHLERNSKKLAELEAELQSL